MTQVERKLWLNKTMVEIRQERADYVAMPGRSARAADTLADAADLIYRALLEMDNQEARLEAENK